VRLRTVEPPVAEPSSCFQKWAKQGRACSARPLLQRAASGARVSMRTAKVPATLPLLAEGTFGSIILRIAPHDHTGLVNFDYPVERVFADQSVAVWQAVCVVGLT
jgi:hypothetical protein